MDFVIGYVTGHRKFVMDAMEQYGWKLLNTNGRMRWVKGGRCVHYVGFRDQIQGIEGKGKWFRALRGFDDDIEKFAMTRRFKIAQTIADFDEEIK